MSQALAIAQFRGPLLIAIVATLCVVLALQRPIAQDVAYHNFADTESVFGIPNGLNVLSNLPFLVVGLVGLLKRGRAARLGSDDERWRSTARAVMFAGVFLIGLGSAWYHLAPSNQSLLWDRLPMTIVFTMFFSIMIGDRLGNRLGRILYLPLLLLGITSVLYWYLGERNGAGDLRVYILVQFAPMLLLPLIALLYPAGRLRARDFWMIMLLYAVAKVVEIADVEIFTATANIISGHTVKHLFAAAATGWMIRLLEERTGTPNTIET
jgi:hypothetical protein